MSEDVVTKLKRRWNSDICAETFDEAIAEIEELREAVRNLLSVTTTCPCGAWLGDEDVRPHVIGCPVAAVETDRDPQ